MSTETGRTEYAHDVEPAPPVSEPHPLAALVRYHYAQSQGHWLAFLGLIQARDYAAIDGPLERFLLNARLAFTYDALAQGMTGQDAADWASVRMHDEAAEITYERGLAAGVDMDAIRAYEVSR